MTEPFELPVTYRGKELLFLAQLLPLGHIYKFRATIYEMQVFFESCEERSYKAVIQPEQQEKAKIDTALLQAIAEAIEAKLK